MPSPYQGKNEFISRRQLKVQSLTMPFVISGTPAPGTGPEMGSLGDFALLGSSTITNTGPSVVTGDLGLSPGTSVTGFPPGTISGTQHIADSAAAQAQLDLTAAYNNLAGRTPDVDLTGQDLGTVGTLTAGVYNFDTSAGLTGTLTLDAEGDPTKIFIFQIGSTLTTAAASTVSLINGALAGNVFWQVGTSATLGTTTTFKGNILAQVSITLNTGASLDGSALARTGAVSLDTNVVSVAASSYTPATVEISTDDQEQILFIKTQFVDQITDALSSGEELPVYDTQSDADGQFSVLIKIGEPLEKIMAAYIVRRSAGNSGPEVKALSLANTNGISEFGDKIALNVDSGENLAAYSLDAALKVFYIVE